jgi:hypothetical protein
MSCHQVEILNYEHSIVELSKGNTLVVTDNNACHSVTIPQSTTCILQVNSPGPQGPGGFPYTGSANITGSLVITGSITFAGGARLTNEYDYVSVDIQAGPGGYVELLSNNQSASVLVTNENVVIVTSGSYGWIFNQNGTTTMPGSVTAPSFIGSSVSITSVLNLSKSNPLPTGTTGSLAVSGSHLYFHNGTSWVQVV